MNVDIIPTFKDISPQKIYGKTAIVLDVFRCTSTIITALANGCKEVIPASDDVEAESLASKLPRNSYILAGEIKGQKLPGFELGNSPVEFTRYPVRQKTVILTTTNGTEAIKICKPAKHVLIGSFLNVSSVCSRAATYQKDIIVACAGTRGNISLEDIMAAGCLIAELKQSSIETRCCDLARTFYYLYKYFKDNLEQILLTSRSGLNLQRLGYEHDITFCLQQDLYRIVPVYKNGVIRLSESGLLSSRSF